MKKVSLLLIAAFVMSGSVSVFAMDNMSKDECLLMSKNCKDQVDTIQQKVKKLNTEIKKGKKVYTPAELKTLQDKLKETNDLLDTLLKPGK